jgi:4-hydroxy-tetrahydrodipicolinate synthase
MSETSHCQNRSSTVASDFRPALPDGVWPVMLTPFTASGAIDWNGVAALTDWYLESGVAGLFTVCLSSEMDQLTPEERLELARYVNQRVDGRASVVASAALDGGTAELQARSIRQMAETGVAAVVVVINRLVTPLENERLWQERTEKLLGLTGDIPLGLYECPSPYHRLLSPQAFGWAAGTGRFIFHKDTTCEVGMIREKLAACRSTSLGFFNANTATLLDSLQAGANGYSGTAANFHPELLVRLCSNPGADDAGELQDFLRLADMAVRHKYPSAAKLFLAQKGLPILPFCRCREFSFAAEDQLILDALKRQVSGHWSTIKNHRN